MKKNNPKYVHRGVTKKGKTISLPTEEGTIQALKDAGGGLYTNILHKFSFTVRK